ncbi:MAG: serine hydrolase [Limisphaerales bacterium]
MKTTWLLLFVAFLAPSIASAQSGGRLAERLRELDKNVDRQLSKEEFGRDEATFKSIDKDGNGGITVAEISAFLRNGGKLNARENPSAKPVEFKGRFTKSMPVNLASCRKASDYSKRASGHAVLVMIAGEVVYEKYDNGWSADQPHRLASGTKSFAGVTAARAAQEGLLNLDESVSDTITEWKDSPRLSKITIRQLLSLTSGIDPGDNSVVLPYAEAIKAEALNKPGIKFAYGPNPFQIFGALMQRKLADKNQTSLDFLRAKILEPIGMKTGTWRRTRNGDPHVPSGAFVTAREWAKFGELLRRGGKWGEKQIVRQDLLDELTRGSRANPAYGITFWLSNKKGLGAGNDAAGRSTTPSAVKLKDLFMAAGAGKQSLYIVPSLKLVAVRFGETQGRRFQDNAFLDRLVK